MAMGDGNYRDCHLMYRSAVKYMRLTDDCRVLFAAVNILYTTYRSHAPLSFDE